MAPNLAELEIITKISSSHNLPGKPDLAENKQQDVSLFTNKLIVNSVNFNCVKTH